MVGGAALLMLGLAELVRKAGGSAELSRKTAHVGSGVLAATFPWVFESPWTVTAMAVVFLLVMVVSRRMRLLDGVHGVDRDSLGAQAFPVVIATLFWLTLDQPLLYAIPILVLAVSDAVAALIGKSYGTVHYRALGERRSFEGSFAFFVATFLVVHIPLLMWGVTTRVDSLLIAASVAVLVTCLEAISIRGLDNLFVPVGTWYALNNYLNASSAQDQQDRLVFFAGAAVVTIGLRRAGHLTRTAAVGVFLCAYAAWSMGGWEWLTPLLGGWLLVLGLSILARRQKPDSAPMGLSHLFQVSVTSVAIVFVWDLTADAAVYPAYLAGVTGATAVVAGGLARRLDASVPSALALSVLLPTVCALPWGPPVPSATVVMAAGLMGLAAPGLVRALGPSAARFTCVTCATSTSEPRHCHTPATLSRGRRWWTLARAAWLSIVAAAVLGLLVRLATR